MKLNKPLSAKKEFEPPKEFIKLLYQQACAGLMLFSYADGLAHIVDGIPRIHRAGWCTYQQARVGRGAAVLTVLDTHTKYYIIAIIIRGRHQCTYTCIRTQACSCLPQHAYAHACTHGRCLCG